MRQRRVNGRSIVLEIRDSGRGIVGGRGYLHMTPKVNSILHRSAFSGDRSKLRIELFESTLDDSARRRWGQQAPGLVVATQAAEPFHQDRVRPAVRNLPVQFMLYTHRRAKDRDVRVQYGQPAHLPKLVALARQRVLVQTLPGRVMGRLKEFLMRSGSENRCPNVRSIYGSARQVSNLELVFPNLLCKLNAADGYRRCLESLEPEHRPNPLFDAAMVLLHNIVQVLAGSYPTDFNSVMARCEAA
jgi:hypothetical protein